MQPSYNPLNQPIKQPKTGGRRPDRGAGGGVRTGGGAQASEDVEEQAPVPPTRLSLQPADSRLRRFVAIHHTCARLPLPAET